MNIATNIESITDTTEAASGFRKTCSKCGEAKPTTEFHKHPLRLYYIQCADCFPVARADTRSQALTVARNATYPGRRYAVFMEIANGDDHWRPIQERIISTIAAI